MAQQWYTITEDGTFGQRQWKTGDQIPMEWAVEWGLDGAALAEGEFFSDEERAAILDVAGGQPNYVSTNPVVLGASAGTLAANRAYLWHFRVAAPLTISKITASIGTPSGNIDVGVYASDGTTLTRLASSSSTAVVSSSNVQTMTFTAVDLVAGVDYYLALAVDNATVTIRRTTSLDTGWTALGKRNIFYEAAFPLPASFVLASGSGSSNLPLLFAEP